MLLVFYCVILHLHADAATSPSRVSSDRDDSKLQLMASMSSVGGGDSLQDIWAMMESGLSSHTATPRHPNIESMSIVRSVFAYLFAALASVFGSTALVLASVSKATASALSSNLDLNHKKNVPLCF